MPGFRRSWVILSLLVMGGAFALGGAVAAQEQFFTQSGGRGLQNAKTNARLSKAEGDIVLIQDDLKTIQPHARAQLGTCANTGEKLRYDGRNWICEKETDPTVKGFAKKDLPTCTGGSILGVSGGELGCVDSGFVSNEADPTVQPYAKKPLPSCGSEQVLSVANGALVCQSDQKGLTLETDPKVHNFARKDVVTALPNCGSNELLTMTGGMLSCKVDSVGITVELDPFTQPFARTDNGQPPLAACGVGHVLNAVTVDGKTVLACTSAAGAVSGLMALNDLNDVNTAGATSGTVLTYSGGEWRALPGVGSTGNPLYLRQLGDVNLTTPASSQLLRFDGARWVNSDDKVGALTDTNWCRVDGGQVVCDRPAPLTCAATEALNWNATTSTWVCEDLGSSIGGSMRLDGLVDVTTTTPVVGQALLYDGNGWANSTLNRIMAGDSQVVVTDSGADGLISFATEGQTHMAITHEGRIGVGVMPSAPYRVDISGSARVAGDLTITGNLNISGTQSLDGVSFANGGIQMPGNLVVQGISATNISASGNISANQFIGQFVGDGSLLTGLTSIPADRISSTNNQAMAVATPEGTVSFTLGGTPGAAYLYDRGLVASGVSTTGGISGTAGYFSGNVGIGVSAPTNKLQVEGGQILITGANNTLIQSFQRVGVYCPAGVCLKGDFLSFLGGKLTIDSDGIDGSNNTLIGRPVNNLMFQPATHPTLKGAIQFKRYNDTPALILDQSTGGNSYFYSNVGIKTATPSTSLHISGTLRIANGGEACDANRAGAIRYANGDFQVCYGSGGWASLVDASGTTVTPDRITSGTTNVIARTDGSISFTTAGTTTGYFYNGQLVANAVSTTGTISGTQLSTSGNLNLPAQDVAGATTNMVMANGSPFIHTFRATGTDGNNLFIGLNSGNTTMTGTGVSASYNTGIGGYTLTDTTTGNYNTAIGRNALRKTTLGHNNSAIGFNALNANTSGYTNTAIGYFALSANTVGYYNTATGAWALYNNINGYSNVATGRYTLTGNTTGTSNTAIGTNTGGGITTGSNNTILGAGVQDLPSDLSNTVIIADGEGSQRIRVDFLGRTGIGQVSPTTRLDVNGTLRIANGGEACDADRAGGIRYNSSNFEFCNGGGTWQSLSAVAASAAAAGVTGSVQFKGGAGEISGTDTLLVNSVAGRADVTVSGTVKLSGDGTESCSGAATYGQMRFIESGGRMVMEVCRP